MATLVKHDTLTATANDNQGRPIGSIVEDEFGGRFMWVKNASADTDAVAGKLAAAKTAGARGEMTMKDAELTDGTLGTVTRPTGVWMAAVPFGDFGWIQVGGRTTTLVTDGGVVDGDYLVMDGGATVTFIADTAVAGEEHAVFAIARAADDANNVVTADLYPLA